MAELGGGSVDVLINNAGESPFGLVARVRLRAGLTGADPFKFGAGEEESIGKSLRTSFDINSGMSSSQSSPALGEGVS